MTGPLRRIAAPAKAALDLVPPGTAPGLVLMAAAMAALAVANSPLGAGYERMWQTPLGPLDLLHWINDALMAVFFFQVGLEVKREIARGDLADPAARRVPMIAAAAGMAVPAFVYLAATGFAPDLSRGWAIPAATDIAFALGVLTLLGDRVPGSLRLFLVSVAIADDIGAIAIIAIFYTGAIVWVAVLVAAAILIALVVVNRRGVTSLWPYMLLAVLLWIAVHESGVHATVAGVLAALFVPLGKDDGAGPLERAEHGLAPWVSYLVLPLFGFANGGVRIGEAPLIAPVPVAIAAGLFLGKQAGVFGAVRILAALGMGQRPEGASWSQVYGVSLLAGIGFTMSLFIGGLAFVDPLLREEAKAGVLMGSLLSGIAGFVVLRFARGGKDRRTA